MKRMKLTESQIIAMLNEAESGVLVDDVCRKYGVSQATYYKFKSKYAGVSVSELSRLKELERENQRLKRLYADLSLEHSITKDILEKKSLWPTDES